MGAPVNFTCIFAELHCDGAGELSSAKLEEALKSQVKGPKPRLEGVDPMRVKSHARMEAAVKDVELGVKRMMLANSMPADKWRWMQKSFIWLRQRFPETVALQRPTYARDYRL